SDHAALQRATRTRDAHRHGSTGDVRPVMKRRPRSRERGQAMVEIAIVAPALILLLFGIVEFGRAWMISNMITHEARQWARIAATASNRDSTGGINTSSIEASARADIKAMTGLDVPGITARQMPIGGIPMVTINVTYDVPFLFNLLPSMTTFHID